MNRAKEFAAKYSKGGRLGNYYGGNNPEGQQMDVISQDNVDN